MIIDSHTHLTIRPNSKFSESFEKNMELMESEMKESGIDMAIVIAWFGRGNSSRPTTEDILRLVNDRPNFKVVASVDIFNLTDADLRTLKEQMKNKLIVGVKLYTGYQHFYPSDERCTPIYKLCIKYDLPLIFHSGDTLAGVVTNPKLKYSHPLQVDDVAVDFPELKIIIAHMGNPWLVDCAEVMYKNPNVYADISGLVVGEDLTTPYGDMMRQRIKDLIDYVGGNEHKLLYATDWPLCPMDTYVKFSQSLGLDKEKADQLFYKNAQKLFKL
jgi:predicted TIM-barrel fold metal-dependent hydrolase